MSSAAITAPESKASPTDEKPEGNTDAPPQSILSSAVQSVQASLPYVAWGLQTGASLGCQAAYLGWLAAKEAAKLVAEAQAPVPPKKSSSTKAGKRPLKVLKENFVSIDAVPVNPPEEKSVKLVIANLLESADEAPLKPNKQGRSSGSKKQDGSIPLVNEFEEAFADIPPELRWLERARLELLTAFAEKIDINHIYDYDQTEDIAKVLASAFGYVMDLKYALAGSPPLLESDLEPANSNFAESAEYQAWLKEYITRKPQHPNALILDTWQAFFGKELLLKMFPRETIAKIRNRSNQWTTNQLEAIQNLLNETCINEFFRYLIPHNSPDKANIFSQTSSNNSWNRTNPHAVIRLAFMTRNRVSQEKWSLQDVLKGRAKMNVFYCNKKTSNFGYIPALINRALDVDQEYGRESFQKAYLYQLKTTNQRYQLFTEKQKDGERCKDLSGLKDAPLELMTAAFFVSQLLGEKYQMSDKDADELERKIPLASARDQPILDLYLKIYRVALEIRSTDDGVLMEMVEGVKRHRLEDPTEDSSELQWLQWMVLAFIEDVISHKKSSEEAVKFLKGH